MHGQSELPGMSPLAELVEERISIRSHRQLVRAIAKAGPELETKALAPALPIGDPQLQEQELERLREAIRAASQEYLKALASWLQQELRGQEVEEILLSGGTVDWLGEALSSQFGETPVRWHGDVAVPERRDPEGLGSRLADAYALFERYFTREPATVNSK